VSGRDGHYQIYVMHPDGRGQTRVTASDESDAWPVWSPDGRWIAFTRSNGRGGVGDLMMIRPDGSGLRTVRSGV
jgi:TolB protein